MELSRCAAYGVGERDKAMESNVIAIRTVNLCIIKHSIGDAFSIEHIYPALLLEFECTKSLLAMPGVFVLTFDNCEHGETYWHRQCLITIQPWLAWLSWHCSGKHVHEQVSGAVCPTVSPYARGLVKHLVHLLNVFLGAPMKLRCMFARMRQDSRSHT